MVGGALGIRWGISYRALWGHWISMGVATSKNLGHCSHRQGLRLRRQPGDTAGGGHGERGSTHSFWCAIALLVHMQVTDGTANWDFATWVPHAVVVNIGTDDDLAGKTAADRAAFKVKFLILPCFFLPCPEPSTLPPPCISYALVQATVGVGTVLIWDLILIRYQT